MTRHTVLREGCDLGDNLMSRCGGMVSFLRQLPLVLGASGSGSCTLELRQLQQQAQENGVPSQWGWHCWSHSGNQLWSLFLPLYPSSRTCSPEPAVRFAGKELWAPRYNQKFFHLSSAVDWREGRTFPSYKIAPSQVLALFSKRLLQRTLFWRLVRLLLRLLKKRNLH